MASITTILGTDSVSASRIVLNNNFAALNQDLENINNLLNTSNQTLNLTGLITGGTLTINNGIDLFKVEALSIKVNLPIDLNQDININGGLVYSVNTGVTAIPSVFGYTTYVLDASSTDFQNQVVLPSAKNGQEITLIATNGPIEINNDNILGVTDYVTIFNGGTLTLRYLEDFSAFCIISFSNCNIVY